MGAIVKADQTQQAKRLGIYFFYDGQGVVDDYVVTMLEGLREHLTDLTVVVNGKLNEAGHERFAQFTDKIIVRPNEGLDVWAYKTALDSYGWEKLVEFDEVILLNSTIMGPVHPFSEMFDAMDPREIDFWGITWFHEIHADPFGTMEYGYIPRHIQSHFMAYRRSLVESAAFQNYWDNMGPINGYYESVGRHEAPFTKRFEDLGFKSDIYINTEDLEGHCYSPILFAARELVENRRCPIFKRRSFFHPYDDILDQSIGLDAPELYAYLRDESDYDVKLIWQNALRTMHLDDLVRDLNLTHVLPSQFSAGVPEGMRVGLVLHLYYLPLLDECLRYIQSMPRGTEVIITTDTPEKVAAIKAATAELPYRFEVRLIRNRGRDVSALLLGAADVQERFDLVCFVHDKKVAQLIPGTKGEGFARKCFDNMLQSRDFVNNVIAAFQKEPNLGMLMPPPPDHAEYYPVYTFRWGPNFENTERLVKDLGLQVPMSRDHELIAPLGTMFWFRPQALRPLFAAAWPYDAYPVEPNNIDGTILHAVERAYCYVAQSQGFVSGWLLSDKYASLELTHLSYYTQELLKTVDNFAPRGTKLQMTQLLDKPVTNAIVTLKREILSFMPARVAPVVEGAWNVTKPARSLVKVGLRKIRKLQGHS